MKLTLLQVLRGGVNHLHGDDLESPLLESAQDLANQVALDTVRLDHDEAAFSGRHFRLAMDSAGTMEVVEMVKWQTLFCSHYAHSFDKARSTSSIDHKSSTYKVRKMCRVSTTRRVAKPFTPDILEKDRNQEFQSQKKINNHETLSNPE